MTSEQFDQLRLGVALAHSVPGAELRISCPLGAHLAVGASDRVSLHICDLRDLVVSGTCPHRPDVSDRIEIEAICGSLQSCGAGIFRSRRIDVEHRWFATLLPPTEVIGVLKRLEHERLVPDAIGVRLTPDSGLGVTVVRLHSSRPLATVAIAEAAETAYGACLVAELLRNTTNGPERSAFADDMQEVIRDCGVELERRTDIETSGSHTHRQRNPEEENT